MKLITSSTLALLTMALVVLSSSVAVAGPYDVAWHNGVRGWWGPNGGFHPYALHNGHLGYWTNGNFHIVIVNP